MFIAQLPDGTEYRSTTEMRAAGRRLEGYAATFDSPAKIADAFTETVRRGAFSRTLTERADVLAMVDHDPGRLLGRTRSGTLRLVEDARGLAFDLDLPDTQLGRDILHMTERGDIGGMSFGFRVVKDEWPARDKRELVDVTLMEVSVVSSWPAYGDTSVAARAAQLHATAALEAARWRRRVLGYL